MGSRSSGPRTRSAVLPISARLEDEDPLVREAAAVTLGAMGPVARQAVPALVAALADTEEGVREAAAGTLGELAAKEAVPALIIALRDPAEVVRQEAAHALGDIGTEATSAVPSLMALCEQHRGPVRDVASWAIKRIRRDG